MSCRAQKKHGALPITESSFMQGMHTYIYIYRFIYIYIDIIYIYIYVLYSMYVHIYIYIPMYKPMCVCMCVYICHLQKGLLNVGVIVSVHLGCSKKQLLHRKRLRLKTSTSPAQESTIAAHGEYRMRRVAEDVDTIAHLHDQFAENHGQLFTTGGRQLTDS